jgi:hypothetical protein
MFSKSARSGFLALSILALCLTSTSTSAQAATRAVKPAPRTVAAPVQVSTVQTLWRGLVRLFAKEGASIDPSGRPTWSSLSATGDEGAGFDPSGLHQS